MEEAIAAKLLASTALVAVVGSRITWGDRLQGGGYPAVTFGLATNTPVYADGGFQGLTGATLQIDCWAVPADGVNGQSKAMQVARLVMAALQNVTFTQGGVNFVCVIPSSAGRDMPAETDQAGAIVSRRMLEFQLWHKEA